MVQKLLLKAFVRTSTSMLQDQSDDHPTRWKRARAHLQLGQRSKAMDDFRFLIDHGYRKADALYELALIHVEREERDTAKVLLEEAIELKPGERDFIEVYHGLSDET